MLIKLHPSSLDRFLGCADSALPAPEGNNPNNPEARLGHAGHEVAAAVAAGVTPDVEAVASHYGLGDDGAEDLGRIHAYAVRFWEEFAPYLANGDVEERLQADLGTVEVDGETHQVVLSGRPDVIKARFEERRMVTELVGLAVHDWKTGYGRTEHPAQILGGALLAVSRYGWPEGEVILGTEAWLRHNDRRVHHITPADIQGLVDRIHEQIRKVGRQRGVGEWCTFCPHRLRCPTRSDYLRTVISDMMAGAAPDGGVPLDRTFIGGPFRQRLEAVERACKDARAILELCLEQGPVDRGDGTFMVLDQRRQDRILYSAAAHVIEGLDLTTEQLDAAVRVGKGKLLEAVASKAVRGKGAAAKRELMSQLGAAGAVVDDYRREVRFVDASALPEVSKDTTDELMEQLRASLAQGRPAALPAGGGES